MRQLDRQPCSCQLYSLARDFTLCSKCSLSGRRGRHTTNMRSLISSMFLKTSLRAIIFVTLVTFIIGFPCTASCVISSQLGVCILHHIGNMTTMASVTCVLREENLVMLTFVQTMQCETSHYCAALNARPILPSTNFFSFNQLLFHYSIDMIFHHMCLYVKAFSHWSHLCGFSAGSKMVWSLYVLPEV